MEQSYWYMMTNWIVDVLWTHLGWHSDVNSHYELPWTISIESIIRPCLHWCAFAMLKYTFLEQNKCTKMPPFKSYVTVQITALWVLCVLKSPVWCNFGSLFQKGTKNAPFIKNCGNAQKMHPKIRCVSWVMRKFSLRCWLLKSRHLPAS